MKPSPEYELIRLAARAMLDPERAEQFREAAQGPLDWTEVYVLAHYHRLVPVFEAHLQEFAPDAAPEEVREAMRHHVRSRALLILFLTSEMTRVGRALDEAGIEHIVLKGPSLAEAYGGAARRPFVDNDLYIRRSDFGAVNEVLLDLGFGKEKRRPFQESGYLFIHGEYSFGRRVGEMISTVDLHTDIVPFGYSYHEPFEALYGRSRGLVLAGHEVRVLSWGDLFLALSVNALKDQWNRLRLASDLAEVGIQIEDWEEVFATAARCRSRRILNTGILVATREVGARFPEPVVRRAQGDAHAVRMAEEIGVHLPRFHEDRVMNSADRARLILQIQDGVLGQLRYLAYVVARRVTEPFIATDERTEGASAPRTVAAET